jgi:hypothetical protein
MYKHPPAWYIVDAIKVVVGEVVKEQCQFCIFCNQKIEEEKNAETQASDS